MNPDTTIVSWSQERLLFCDEDRNDRKAEVSIRNGGTQLKQAHCHCQLCLSAPPHFFQGTTG